MGFQPIIPGTNPLASDVQQIIDALTGGADAGALSLFAPINPPAAPTVAVSQTAGVLNGAYTYKITCVTGFVRSDGTLVYTGETQGGATSASVSPANQQVTLSNIPVGPAGVIARRIYRTAAGGADGTQKLVAEISDNVTTTYVDNVADASLGAAVPTTNTTGTTLDGKQLSLGTNPKFDPATGHKHTGAAGDAPNIPPSSISPQGANSGLDADKVDGQHASAFQPALGYTPARIATGTYTGDGGTSRAITVGFAPIIVFLIGSAISGSAYMMASGPARSHTDGSDTGTWDNNYHQGAYIAGLTASGFTVPDASNLQGNVSGQTYYWTAIG